MIPPRPTKRRFHVELDRLQAKLMEMAGLAEDLVRRSVDAFLRRDAEEAAVIRAVDARIDTLEIELDNRATELIALHQPVASDLRQILTALKISNDLERVGDHAVNIAKATRRLARQRPVPDLPEMAELAFLSQQMLRDSLASFATRDAELAREICARDDRVDDMRKAVHQILVSLMTEQPDQIYAALDYVRVAQQLERIGDLATNISEEVVFFVEGRTIKHHAEASEVAVLDVEPS